MVLRTYKHGILSLGLKSKMYLACDIAVSAGRPRDFAGRQHPQQNSFKWGFGRLRCDLC